MPKIFTIVALTLFVNISLAQDADPNTDYVMCRSGEIVRTIRVDQSQSENCRTIYTKLGVDREVGSGRMVASCFKILTNIRKNLETAGWKCKDISAAKISTPPANNE